MKLAVRFILAFFALNTSMALACDGPSKSEVNQPLTTTPSSPDQAMNTVSSILNSQSGGAPQPSSTAR
jgi:hypothetical protein